MLFHLGQPHREGIEEIANDDRRPSLSRCTLPPTAINLPLKTLRIRDDIPLMIEFEGLRRDFSLHPRGDGDISNDTEA